jgi:hypothetical protein
MKYTKEEAYKLLEYVFCDTPVQYVETIDMFDSEYPLIKKVNFVTGAFVDIYIKNIE